MPIGKTRIAYVINSLEGGGAASPVPAILDVLAGTGADVCLLALTLRNGKAAPAIREAGIDMVVRNGGEKDHLAAYGWLKDQLHDWKATHVWTSLTRATLLGQLAGARLGLPVVSWQHNAYLKPWNERLLRWSHNRSCLWVADSNQVAELTQTRLGIPAERLFTWPIFFADPHAPVARPWQAGETLKLGSLGRLHPAKGYDVLLEALTLLRQRGFMPPVPFEITIAGEGEQRDALIAAANHAGIANISFPGFAENPRAYLAEQHLYVQPSRREGFCIAAHEAMQAGLPVLVSSTGELPFTVREHETGRIVPPENALQLADALREMLIDPARLKPMGEAGRALVLKRFSKEHFRENGQTIVSRLTTLAPKAV